MQNVQKDLWNANLYDQNHAFVSKYGHDLIELLQPKHGEAILDIGCGTGDLANELAGLGAQVVGIDQSDNMIAQAKNKYPDIAFQTMDATALPYNVEFDAIFSNATLHWIKSPRTVLEAIYRSIKPGGRFVAEFGGKGNVQMLTDAFIQQIRLANVPYTDDQFPWYFPSIGEYTALMESVGFEVGFAQHFSRPTKLDGENGMEKWFEMFAPSIFEQIDEATKQEIFTATIENLRPKLYKNDSWYADYKRLQIMAIKP